MNYTTDPSVLQKELKAALKKAGVLVPERHNEAVVAFVLAYGEAQRNRLADVIDSLSSLYDQLDQEQIDTLARLVRRHHVDADGNLCPQDD